MLSAVFKVKFLTVPEAQLRALYEYCEKNGVVVIREYIDRARSATTDDRPEFIEMIKASKEQKFDIVLVHKLDRFARNRYDSAFYRKELKRNGVTLMSVLEQIDDTPEGIILESMLEGMSEYYSKNLSREVKKGMKENALKCISTGGRPPFGLKIDPETRKYVIDEAEAPAVRFIFESVKNGVGYNEVIRELNAMGYHTRLGKPFGKNSIHEILRNEKYKGVYLFNRAVSKNHDGKRNNHSNKYDEEIIRIEGGIEQIVDTLTFDTVTKIIGARRRQTPSSAKEVYLLTGKVFCGECGSAFTGNRKRSGRNKDLYVTYRCGGRNLKAGVDCKNKEVRREYLEDFVLRELARVIFNKDTIDEIVRQYNDYCINNNTDEVRIIEVIKVNLSTINAKITNVVSIMTSTGSKTLIKTLEELETEREQLESELIKKQANCQLSNIDENQIRRAYEIAREQYLNGTLKEKEQLINQYLNKVVVYQEHIEVYLNRLPTYLLKVQEFELKAQKKHKNDHNPAKISKIVAEAGGGEGS